MASLPRILFVFLAFMIVLNAQSVTLSLSAVCIGFYSDNAAAEKAYRVYSEYRRAQMGHYTSYHARALKVFDESSFTEKKSIASLPGFDGYNYSNIFQAMLGERKVFIKFSPLSRLKSGGMNEASYAKLMSDLGLGPRFHGVYKSTDGKIVGYITDFVEGVGVKHKHMLGEEADKSSVVAHFLKRMGVDVVHDLQYRKDEAASAHWIVDTNFSPLPTHNTYETFKQAYLRVRRIYHSGF